jgi:hypothetical protein
MIWLETAPGQVESGYYRIHRGVSDYQLWFTHPKALKLIGRARTLGEAKGDAVRYAEKLKQSTSGEEPK